MPGTRTALLLPALLLLLLAAAPGTATTLVYLSLEDLTGLSDDLVIGRVVSVEPYLDHDGQTIFSAVTLEVAESVRGTTAAHERIVLHHLGGEVNGIALRYSGMPTFDPDRDVAVFLRHLGGQAYGLVGMGQGVLEVEERDGRLGVVRRLSSLRFVNPRMNKRLPVEEAHEDEFYTLTELRQSVLHPDRVRQPLR